MIVFHPQKHPSQQLLLFTSCYRWENWDSEGLRNFLLKIFCSHVSMIQHFLGVSFSSLPQPLSPSLLHLWLNFGHFPPIFPGDFIQYNGFEYHSHTYNSPVSISSPKLYYYSTCISLTSWHLYLDNVQASPSVYGPKKRTKVLEWMTYSFNKLERRGTSGGDWEDTANEVGGKPRDWSDLEANWWKGTEEERVTGVMTAK